MGKYATYRKRGATTGAESTLPVPPPPAMPEPEEDLRVRQFEPDNTGGVYRLYYSEAGVAPWDHVATVAWAGVQVWGDVDDYDAGSYYSTTVGNGVDFAGESDPSNIIVLE